jgi:hypothetical protein
MHAMSSINVDMVSAVIHDTRHNMGCKEAEVDAALRLAHQDLRSLRPNGGESEL